MQIIRRYRMHMHIACLMRLHTRSSELRFCFLPSLLAFGWTTTLVALHVNFHYPEVDGEPAPAAFPTHTVGSSRVIKRATSGTNVGLTSSLIHYIGLEPDKGTVVMMDMKTW
jgi:hypothetical protein